MDAMDRIDWGTVPTWTSAVVTTIALAPCRFADQRRPIDAV
jgi:hypothetical protein